MLAFARALALTTFLLAPAAGLAQVNVYVAVDGSTTDPCGAFATPCRYLSQGVAKVSPGGVVHVSPGDYLAVLINKEVELIADQGLASIVESSTVCGDGHAGICVNPTEGGDVRIRGILINHRDESAAGIRVISGEVHVERCTLLKSRFEFGLEVRPSSGVVELYVSESVISENESGAPESGGILIKPTGSARVTAVLENVSLENNYVGLFVDGTGASVQSIKVNLVDSVIANNSAQGVVAYSPANGAPVDVTVRNSIITGNGHAGLFAQGATASGRGSAILRFGGSNISNNVAGVLAYGQGIVRSLGGNFVDANGVSGNGPFTVIAPE
jgi:hypothetical protein